MLSKPHTKLKIVEQPKKKIKKEKKKKRWVFPVVLCIGTGYQTFDK